MTRLAIISDIHGNLPALEATLADIASQGISSILCLGDVATFGPQPRDTMLKLQALNCPVIMGNGDMDISNPAPLGKTNWEADIANWCKTQLEDQDRAYVGSFSPWLTLELANIMILAYHGSPKSFYDSITATTPDETLETYFSGLHADVYMGGHIHEQFLRRFGTSRVMNPGSVGLPFNLKARVTPTLAIAEYAILEVLSTEPNLTFRRIPYDFTRLKRAAQNSGMPHWQQWLDWL